MRDKRVKIELSFDEVNIILKALGTLPFNQVFELIGSIHEQANQQVYDSQDAINNDLRLKNNK